MNSTSPQPAPDSQDWDPFTQPDRDIHRRLPKTMQLVFSTAVVLELVTREAKRSMPKQLYKPQHALELNQKASFLLSDIRAECQQMIQTMAAEPSRWAPFPSTPQAGSQTKEQPTAEQLDEGALLVAGMVCELVDQYRRTGARVPADLAEMGAIAARILGEPPTTEDGAP